MPALAPPRIRAAGPADMDAVARLTATAQVGNEIAHWLVGYDTERVRVYERYFDFVTPWFFEPDNAHGRREVHMTEDGTGAALWVHLDGKFGPDIADYDARLRAACGLAVPRFITLDEVMYTNHPDGQPHAYLAFLSVAPHTQGTGVGSALLKHMHQQLDATGTPAYLEATGPRCSRLYHQHGYVIKRLLPLAPGGPYMRAMWRDPQPR
ncbi:GNAT family N-acetyltransferase [Dactylosporangium darangshiense]|uniref:GNAT family N-acetyltransferase n=1 Tax=Dactylosporangium darangshiense TaxID=579108 RepID=A0ABP8DWL5_9ACTN